MGELIKFMIDNIGHVFPILLSGAFALVIMIERTMALSFSYPMENLDGFFQRLRSLVMKDAIQEAIALCEQFRAKPVARVVRAGLMRIHQPDTLIENGLQLAVTEAMEKVGARTPFLATIANVATLFGLLGTIIGLVQSFKAVGSASAQMRSALLAQGISTAMNATMLGLGVAIPCMIAYSYFQSRTGKINSQIDQAATRTMDLLQQRYFAAETASLNQGEDGNDTARTLKRRSGGR